MLENGGLRLYDLIADFQDLDPEERLADLVEFADELPEPSGGRSDAGPPPECRVQECQTPVYLWVELVDGRTHIEADVPRKSPTVRGLVALLAVGLEGATPEEVLAIPDDLLARLGLDETLGMTRQQGFRGVVARIKREIARATAP